MPRILVTAAEASADSLAAAVIECLRATNPNIEAFGIAGPALRSVGVEAVARTEDISVMGLTEVVPALPRILGIMSRVTREAAHRRPDLAILVDSPDLNLRMARRLRRLGVPILYFVAPMVWAWRQWRTREVSRVVDRLCVILPFEEKVWLDAGVQVTYVGHPMVDLFPAVERGSGSPAEARVEETDVVTVALLPGSRRMEVVRCLPAMLRAVKIVAARREGPVRIVIPVAPTIDEQWVSGIAGEIAPELHPAVSRNGAREALVQSDAAVVASGTVALEAALAHCPMVVVYRVSWGTWFAGRTLVRAPFVSLPNLLMGREIVPELLQADMQPESVAAELDHILPGGKNRERMKADLEEVRRLLGPGGAADRVALEAEKLMNR